jgi:hypothetical protein
VRDSLLRWVLFASLKKTSETEVFVCQETEWDECNERKLLNKFLFAFNPRFSWRREIPPPHPWRKSWVDLSSKSLKTPSWFLLMLASTLFTLQLQLQPRLHLLFHSEKESKPGYVLSVWSLAIFSYLLDRYWSLSRQDRHCLFHFPSYERNFVEQQSRVSFCSSPPTRVSLLSICLILNLML